jgi:hypothetical protein
VKTPYAISLCLQRSARLSHFSGASITCRQSKDETSSIRKCRRPGWSSGGIGLLSARSLHSEASRERLTQSCTLPQLNSLRTTTAPSTIARIFANAISRGRYFRPQSGATTILLASTCGSAVRLAKTNLESGAMSRLAPPEGRPRLTILNSGRTLGTPHRTHATHAVGAIGGGRAISFASLRRFCAIAARVNSNCAPAGPRSRNRPSRRMRFRCANSISIFLR